MSSEYKYLVGANEAGEVTPYATVASRSKYVEPQSASGNLTLDASRDTFYDTITLTGPTAITFTGTVKGAGVLINLAGSAACTVAGVPVKAGQVVALAGDTWKVIQAGVVMEGASTSTITAGTLAASVTTTRADLSVTGALDTGPGLHAQPYRFSKDNGTTWTAWQSGATYRYADLTPSTSGATSTYIFKHQVRNSAGQSRSGAAVSKTMGAVITWTTLSTLGFTAADGTLANTLTMSDGKSFSAGNSLVVQNNEATVNSTDPEFSVSFSAAKARVSLDYKLASGGSGVSAWLGVGRGFYPNLIIDGSGSIRCQVSVPDYTVTITKSSGAPSSGTMTVEYDSTSNAGTFYVDGVEVGSYYRTGTSFEGPISSLGGRLAAGHQLTCSMDNLKIEVA